MNKEKRYILVKHGEDRLFYSTDYPGSADPNPRYTHCPMCSRRSARVPSERRKMASLMDAKPEISKVHDARRNKRNKEKKVARTTSAPSTFKQIEADITRHASAYVLFSNESPPSCLVVICLSRKTYTLGRRKNLKRRRKDVSSEVFRST